MAYPRLENAGRLRPRLFIWKRVAILMDYPRMQELSVTISNR